MEVRHVGLSIATIFWVMVSCSHPTGEDLSAHAVEPDEPDEPEAPAEADEPPLEAETEPEVPVETEAPDEAVAAAPTRRMGAPEILGRTRAQLEERVGPASSAEADWAHYDAQGGFAVQFLGDEGRASRVRYVLSSVRCIEAARTIGFDQAGAPLRRRERCEWPGISMRHRLGPGVAGRLYFDSGIFEVWSR